MDNVDLKTTDDFVLFKKKQGRHGHGGQRSMFSFIGKEPTTPSGVALIYTRNMHPELKKMNQQSPKATITKAIAEFIEDHMIDLVVIGKNNQEKSRKKSRSYRIGRKV